MKGLFVDDGWCRYLAQLSAIAIIPKRAIAPLLSASAIAPLAATYRQSQHYSRLTLHQKVRTY